MGGPVSENKARSLGELIIDLEPGKPCPWCGCSLEGARPLEDVAGRSISSGERPFGGPDLVCPECGCEVSEGGRGGGSSQGGSFSAAA